MSNKTENPIKLALAAFIVFLVLIGARIPFLQQTLIAEEGLFAILVTGYDSHQFSQESNILTRVIGENCLLLIAHIDTQGDLAFGPSRNIAPYCFLGLIVKPIVNLFTPQLLSFDEKSFLIRATFLFLSGIGMASLCILSFLVSRKIQGIRAIAPFIVLIYLALCPLALGASIQPQIDGVFGFLLLSNAVLFLYIGSQISKSYFTRLIFAFLAGVLIALCKNEWPLTLLVSCFIVFFLSFILDYFFGAKKLRIWLNQAKGGLLVVSSLGLGCILGMGICYLISPKDYISGFTLMSKIHRSDLSHFTMFFESLIINFEFLIPIISTLILGGLCVFYNYRVLLGREIGLLVLYIWSWGIFIGFLQSGWSGDGFPRYFLPSLIVSGAFLITQLPAILKGKVIFIFNFILIVLSIFVTLSNYRLILDKFHQGQSITTPGNYREVRNSLYRAAALNRADPYGILAHQPSLALYFPGTNFITLDIGVEDIKKWPLPSSKYYIVF
jgi:hypothetical protein